MDSIIRSALTSGSLIVCLASSIPSASAQESGPAADDIAPYLDDAAVAIVAVDLEQLDLERLSQQAGGSSDDGLLPAAEALLRYSGSIVAALRDNGAGTVYAVYSLHDVTRTIPYLVVPTAGEDDAQQMSRLLTGGQVADGSKISLSYPSAFTRGRMVIAGNDDLEARLDPDRVPDRSESLAQALAVKLPGAVRLISVTTDDQRRVLAEMLPPLPEELGGLSGAQIADGLHWMAVAADLSAGTVEGIIEAKDAAKAGVLADGLPQLLNGIATSVLDKQSDEPLLEMIRSLRFTTDERRIRLSMADPSADRRKAVLASLLSRIAPAALEIDLKRSLKQFGLAMHNFHHTYGSFPPSASYDESGKPLLSWRVYLLPYLGESGLYNQFHLDEPWDSPHNRALIDKMPEVFSTEHFDLNLEGKTTFLVPTGDTAAFHGQAGIAIRDIKDGTSNTIMVLDVPREHAVIWTKPEDFAVDRENLKQALFGGREKFWTALFDGSARALSDTVPEDTIRKLFTYDGGEVLGEF